MKPRQRITDGAHFIWPLGQSPSIYGGLSGEALRQPISRRLALACQSFRFVGGSTFLGLEFAAAFAKPWHRISAGPRITLRWLHARHTLLSKGSSRRLDLVPVRGSAAICSVALLDRGSSGPNRRRLPESCLVRCQAGFPNHHEFADPIAPFR